VITLPMCQEACDAGSFRPRSGMPSLRKREADDSLDHETAAVRSLWKDQIACADIVLLSKADLAGARWRRRSRAQGDPRPTRRASVPDHSDDRRQ